MVYFYSERPPLFKYFILHVVYFYSERPPLLPRRVARDFGGVNQIYINIYIFFFFGKVLKTVFWFTTRMVFDYASSTAMILEPLGSIVVSIVKFKIFVMLGVQTS